MAVIVRQEVVVLLMGGIFVLETASVILQVASFKLRGKRIFRMAPIHHHFELKGWAEPKVIVRFWIISLLLVLAGLATLEGALMACTARSRGGAGQDGSVGDPLSAGARLAGDGHGYARGAAGPRASCAQLAPGLRIALGGLDEALLG